MNAPGESEDRFHELGRMPAGEELRIDTTNLAISVTGLFLFMVIFLAGGFIFTYTWPIYMLIGMIALLFLGYRYGVVLDRYQRTVSDYYNFFGLSIWKAKPFPIAAQAMVKITVRILQGPKGDVQERFNVHIACSGGVEDDDEGQLLEAYTSHGKARRLAEQAATFFTLGIADFSSGKKLVRDAQAVNESLRERLVRYGRAPVMPSRPVRCRIRERVVGDWVELILPKVDAALFPTKAINFAVIALATYVCMLIYYCWAEWIKGTPSEPYFFWIGIGLIFISLAAYGLYVLSYQERVRVSKDGLILVTTSIYRRRRQSIPSEELEELFTGFATDTWIYKGRYVVVARSDELSLEFGARLTDDERRWLRDVIFYLVTAPEGKA